MVAQLPDAPRGMYVGGNELRFEGNLEGSAIAGSVHDREGNAIPRTRVQVQVQGRDEILKDSSADDKGRFKVRGLPAGQYWVGFSAPGFNLHYWHLTVARFRGRPYLQVALSLGR